MDCSSFHFENRQKFYITFIILIFIYYPFWKEKIKTLKKLIWWRHYMKYMSNDVTIKKCTFFDIFFLLMYMKWKADWNSNMKFFCLSSIEGASTHWNSEFVMANLTWFFLSCFSCIIYLLREKNVISSPSRIFLWWLH